MNINNLDYKKVYGKIKRRFIYVIIILLLLLTTRQIIMQFLINQHMDMSEIINIAGRQRMLSQKITKDVLLLDQSDDPEQITLTLENLKDNLEIWRSSHILLQKDDKYISDTTKELYQNIESSHQKILNASSEIITMYESNELSKDFLSERLSIILDNEDLFLDGMNHIVYQYDQEDREDILLIEKAEIILFIFILFSVLLIIIFIAIPAEKTLKTAFIEINENNKTTKDMAIKDQLTGLYNRYFLDSMIHEELENADKMDKPFSIASLDLDFFKRINDTFGHPVGDTVLKQTAETISKLLRPTDYFIRVGGEEFIILMLDTTIDEAYALAEDMRKAIENSTHPVAGKYTASFGVAERKIDENFRNLYNRVDEALYLAKQSGRNCVMKSLDMNEPQVNVALQWKEEWNCSDELINNQHKELFTLGNNIINMSFSSYDVENSMTQIDQLLDHIYTHFQDEEELLKKINYVDLEKHIALHTTLREKGRILKDRCIKNEVNLNYVVKYILEEVIVGHLLNDDLLFFPHVK